MPLLEAPAVVETSYEVVDTLHGIFSPHPGKRLEEILLRGTSMHTPEASLLSDAPHFKAMDPLIARFPSSTGPFTRIEI
ncbi:hypothetical protein AbraIFM66950_000060 [Aspergillus brasiliensis]|nr:hypothetical protein AbraIFM66950_000060 [Aspergillus brasiliensis]